MNLYIDRLTIRLPHEYQGQGAAIARRAAEQIRPTQLPPQGEIPSVKLALGPGPRGDDQLARQIAFETNQALGRPRP